MKFYGWDGQILRIGARTPRFAGRTEKFFLDKDEQLFDCKLFKNAESVVGVRWTKVRNRLHE